MTPQARLVREARARMRTTDVVTRPDGTREMDPAGNPLRRVLEQVKRYAEGGDAEAIREAAAVLRAVLA